MIKPHMIPNEPDFEVEKRPMLFRTFEEMRAEVEGAETPTEDEVRKYLIGRGAPHGEAEVRSMIAAANKLLGKTS